MEFRMPTQTEKFMDGFVQSLDGFYMNHPDLDDSIPEQYRDDHVMRGFYMGCHFAGLFMDQIEGYLRISIDRKKREPRECNEECHYYEPEAPGYCDNKDCHLWKGYPPGEDQCHKLLQIGKVISAVTEGDGMVVTFEVTDPEYLRVIHNLAAKSKPIDPDGKINLDSQESPSKQP